jgi:hypothetical protein
LTRERKKEREPRGSDLTLEFCKFSGVSHSKRLGENLKEKQEGNGGSDLTLRFCRLEGFSEGDKARVSLDIKYPLFKQASDKGIRG